MAPLLGSWAGRPWQEGGLSLAALSSAGWAGRRGGLGVLQSPQHGGEEAGSARLSRVRVRLWSPEASGNGWVTLSRSD